MALIKFAIKLIGAIMAALLALSFCWLLWNGLGIIVNVWAVKVILQWGIIVPLTYGLYRVAKLVFKEATVTID